MAHILIVDDDPAVRSGVNRILSRAGHSVTEADSGDAATSFLENHNADVVIMDVVMPQKGGIEAIMEIHSKHPSIDTVIMSGKVPLDAEAVSSLMERYGAKAVLAKPFTGGELLAVVNEASGSSS